MTSLHTLPIPRPTAPPHEHAWTVDSRHTTSEGTVVYVRCVGCGVHRVDLQTDPHRPPLALSRETSD
ncbi:hypothetical protein [Microbacterium sp. Root553]|uniref:hypothetical protein n=1 Tax=Microbacterium sp. Root553 TaxID=1736556 RepID=UPI00070233FB|nr:hypothetical protein [Microbacterium sp. Root553]KQZ22643.1 hypothetical protein ASD43_15220 [Microbacterium sp. Root553]